MASDAGIYDSFGFSVSIDGSNAIIGTYPDDIPITSAYIYSLSRVLFINGVRELIIDTPLIAE